MAYRLLFLLICISLSSFSSPENQSNANEDDINVLIVDGFSNHDWQHTTHCIQSILKRAKGLNISISTYPADGTSEELACWNPRFSDYDVVIQTCNDLGGGPQWPRSIEEALETFVQDGGGLYVYHGGNNAFPHWEAYNKMIGLGWRDKDFGWAITVGEDGSTTRIPAGEGNKTSHGPRFDALLTRVGDHPIHNGFPRQWVAADIEVYTYARGPAENLAVLSFAKDPELKINFPVEWIVEFGKGRVYNSTLGHVWANQSEPMGIRCVGFQTLLPRIVQGLAGREVDSSLPDDSPDHNAAQLRPYGESVGHQN